MEKIKGPIWKTYPFVRIYSEDIQEIIDILKGVNPKEIKIKTKDYLLKIDELKNINDEELSYLAIDSYQPYISIEFQSGFVADGVKVYCSEETILMHGVVKKIGDLLRKNKRIFFNIFTKKWLVYIILPLGSFFAKPISNLLRIKWYLILIFVFMIVVLSIISDSGLFKKNIIVLKSRRSYPNFWKRNKDNIMLVIISNMVTAVITAIVTYWASK